jgi:hypothetical protein
MSGGPAVGEAAPVPAEPSWGQVLATTVKLWVLGRLRAVDFRQQRDSGRPSRTWLRVPPGHLRQLTARRRRLAAPILALAVVAVAALEFAGAFAGTAAPSARVPSAGNRPADNAGPVSTHGTSTQAAPAAAQAEAAAWIAGQVSSDMIVACDPVMCTALQSRGVSAGRLLMLRRPGAESQLGAGVIVASSSIPSPLADEYAPALIASFGSGGDRIDVRGTVPGGPAGYASALRADLAARVSAGSQLLRNRRLQFTAREAAQLRAGEVDSRVLATLAALSSRYSFRVTAFGGTSPGVQVLFREVSVTRGGSSDSAAELAAALDMVDAQDPPYLPAEATIIHPAAGRAALRIEFAAPSPLGLLTPVLASDRQRVAAAGSVTPGAFPWGRH